MGEESREHRCVERAGQQAQLTGSGMERRRIDIWTGRLLPPPAVFKSLQVRIQASLALKHTLVLILSIVVLPKRRNTASSASLIRISLYYPRLMSVSSWGSYHIRRTSPRNQDEDVNGVSGRDPRFTSEYWKYGVGTCTEPWTLVPYVVSVSVPLWARAGAGRSLAYEPLTGLLAGGANVQSWQLAIPKNGNLRFPMLATCIFPCR